MRMPISLLGAALALGACTGTVHTKSLASLDAVDNDGIVTYPSAMFLEKSYLTTGVTEDKKPLYFRAQKRTDRCRKTPQFKIATYPDYSKPMLVSYVPGWLESNKFGVTLANGNGVVTGVNSESNPDRGQTLTNVTSALGTIAGIFAAKGVEEPLPPCTASPVLVKVEPYVPGKDVEIDLEDPPEETSPSKK